MKDFLKKLKEKERIELLCKEYGLNLTMLKQLTRHRANGLSMYETATKMGIHLTTIKRYDAILKDIPKKQSVELWNYCLQEVAKV